MHRTVKAVINYEAAKDIDTHIHRCRKQHARFSIVLSKHRCIDEHVNACIVGQPAEERRTLTLS